MSDAKNLSVFCQSKLGEVVKKLQSQQLLAYPTESVWGLGCDASCADAVERVIAIKNRDIDKGMIVLTDDVVRLKPVICHLDQNTQQQIIQRISSVSIETMYQKLQAVTWVLPISESCYLPKNLTGQFQSLAVRVTPHPLLRKLCRQLISQSNPCGFLVSTSCNPSGEIPANSLQQAQDYFLDTINYLDAQSLGFCKPSCIIDALTGQIVR